MRSTFSAAVLLALTAPVAVHAAEAPKFATATSTIDDLLANPQAKAVIEKHLPQLMQYASQIGGQTLKQIQAMAPDSKLAAIDADLAQIK